jgi:hypothetical protein
LLLNLLGIFLSKLFSILMLQISLLLLLNACLTVLIFIVFLGRHFISFNQRW